MNEQANDHTFGSIKATDRLWHYFKARLDLVESIQTNIRDEEGDMWTVVYPLTFSAIDKGKSALALAQIGKTRDCFMLARSLFDIVVNICFIYGVGDEAASSGLFRRSSSFSRRA